MVEARQAVFQTPRPEVRVYRPDGALKLEFTSLHKKGLQAYSFGTKVNDVRGRFSLTFHPDEEDYETPVFDNIEELDVVEIYESRNHYKQHPMEGTPQKEIFPAFTGIVRKKRYAAQENENGVSRKFVISGHSAAGLIADFHLNMDINAQIITGDMANGDAVANELSIDLLMKENKPRRVTEVVKIIWDHFIKVGGQYRKSANIKIEKISKDWMGKDFFDIGENIYFHYPLGCVFNGKSDAGFFDVIESVLPSPVYEKYAYMDRSAGKMKIKIRECPFDSNAWRELKCYPIPDKLVKAIDIEQSDDEIYTVFFSYLNGYAVQEDKLIKLLASALKEKEKQMPGLEYNDEKFSIYGYRPLMVHFIGYAHDEKVDDTTTEEKLQGLNKRLKDWYGNLERMYAGSITLETDLSMDAPQAGERIAFLGGEFYVEDSEHRWNYGSGPETALTLSRGGIYTAGGFKELAYWGKKA